MTIANTTVGPPPPFDPELAAALEAMPELPPSLTIDIVGLMREANAERDATDDDLARGGAFEVAHHTADGPHGDVPLLVVRPAGATTTAAVYYIHGGGMVMGDYEMEDARFDRLCPKYPCVGLSVEYRLAPDTPYPGALDDCYAGLRWAYDNAAALSIDRDRIGVGGLSAGGGLAAALALLARDRGEIPVAFQLLECPMVDDRQVTPSSQLDGLAIWPREANTFG
ncbi:MAG: alpha/beta hydrolase fold domain-containing protein, partial [Umezawaea sp.]